MSLAETCGLWGPERQEQAARVARLIEEQGIEVVRLSFPDQHGVLRGKTLVAGEAVKALRAGCLATSTLLLKDTAHRTVFPVFSAGGGLGLREFEGAADLAMLPDPSTFRVLPWAEGTGFLLCDLFFRDGRPFPFDGRGLYRKALARLADQGRDFVAGIEVEFHLYRMADPRLAPEDATQPGRPPEVGLLSKGYQYLTEQRYDQMAPALDPIRRAVLALGLPLRSVEVEFGPSQCEFTFAPTTGLEPADLMVLFRSCVKQVAARHGYHATFMCRPQIANSFASGWHLHQSLRERDGGRNLFMASEDGQPLSALGRHYLAGLLHHARAAAVFTTPTINGYKRYRGYSLAPDRAIWACDNRGVMVRVLGGPGDPATRLENRAGEPLANPYLYMASQIHAGLDGIARGLEPGASADAPYEAEAPLLPKSLREAVIALGDSAFFRDAFGSAFIDYYLRIKSAEIERFQAEVTDWEQREYFDLF
ncbi:glutamine synthetase family protein [uncultured Methylobacterium sp.]|jgi:glutamine synthetase|uniref:glutamine synthetase family protein n=1 Tax=uncultured Methylobacterium sp. TaxID=157278 RepID=UPI00262E7F1D|nr:glutamine synthetase family protein [uncultured Methylobacterium sp.]